MLQHNEARDWVLASEKEHSVKECVTLAFKLKNIHIEWEGNGIDEIGKDKETGIIRVKVNPLLFRPAEVENLLGDSTDAKTILKWNPQYNFESIIEEMIHYDLIK